MMTTPDLGPVVEARPGPVEGTAASCDRFWICVRTGSFGTGSLICPRQRADADFLEGLLMAIKLCVNKKIYRVI